MRDQQKKLRLLMLGLGVAAVAWCGAYLIGNTDDDIAADLNYTAIIKDVKKSVYDGDTILDVPALLYRLDDAETAASAPIWPGIQKRANGIYVLSDIRLRGIDAPGKKSVDQIARGGAQPHQKARCGGRGVSGESD